MRGLVVPLALIIAAAGCDPVIPEGRIACTADEACPSDGWHCLDGYCWQRSGPQDASVGCGECPEEYECSTALSSCLHPCVRPGAECPAGTACYAESGCHAFTCASESECPRRWGCSRVGECWVECSDDGDCPLDSTCEAALCEPVRESCEVIADNFVHVPGADCVVGRNTSFGTSDLSGWCCLWEPAGDLPFPHVWFENPGAPIVEIMGRDPDASSGIAAAFSLVQRMPEVDLDLDRVLDYSFETSSSALLAGTGVTLQVLFITSDPGRPLVWARTWTVDPLELPGELSSANIWLMGPPASPDIRALDYRMPPTSLRAIAEEVEVGGSELVREVYVAITYWSRAQRTRVRHGLIALD